MKSNVVEFITENTIFPNGMESKAIKFLQYLDCEKDDFYYPLTKIKKITELDTESSLALARFFCGSNVSLLEPQYVYVTHDDEVISISKTTSTKVSDAQLIVLSLRIRTIWSISIRDD